MVEHTLGTSGHAFIHTYGTVNFGRANDVDLRARIGDATNTNEVLGYWAFLAGVILGFLGFIIYSMTPAATMSRGVVFALIGVLDAVLGGWVFGLWFTAFIATIDICWDLLKYRERKKETNADTHPDQDSPSGFAPTVQIAQDTKIGFVVTVFALIALILSFYLALALTTAF